MTENDRIDAIQAQWATERPDLDTGGFGVVGRLLLLGKLLERRVGQALEPHELALSSFDVLATLRRQGAPYRLTPTELSRTILLTPGAMTNRIDRLEAAGLVRREAQPGDRRGVRVSLTEQGLATVDSALEARFDEATSAVANLPERDRTSLERILRRLLAELEGELPPTS
ncbi:MAG: MarR family transcriptional regulator [Planctomycetota bacterium]|nr:MAG: MarR family transcriptional regulator [Planctomycetota bacterium]